MAAGAAGALVRQQFPVKRVKEVPRLAVPARPASEAEQPNAAAVPAAVEAAPIFRFLQVCA